jgi:NAD(P)-dependent dehydrogenase (short-subunit alcohol dehydrogenase family)
MVLVGRDLGKLRAVAEQVTAAGGSAADVLTCDFRSFDQVRALAATLLDRYERIDVLASNAGIMTGRRQLTPDGHELIIQVNHLSPFLLTHLLLDRLAASQARVVITSSRAARAGRLDPEDLDRDRRRWNAWLQYGDSNLANALTAVALARLGRGITPTSFHPGFIRTNFASDTFYMKLVMALPGLTRSPEQGARTLVHLATAPDATDHPGGHYVACRPARVPGTMSDPALAERLWTASLAIVAP